MGDLLTGHPLLVLLMGTAGVLCIMGGVELVVHTRRVWTYFTKRRARRPAWYRSELAVGRRAFFWIPSDIALDSPNDVYEYVLSDRFWTSWLGWVVRALFWYAGALLIMLGLIVLGVGLLTPP